ncbi:MAG: hypothetical protein ABIA76_00420 [Candidatus Diapherotrites archaeon]
MASKEPRIKKNNPSAAIRFARWGKGLNQESLQNRVFQLRRKIRNKTDLNEELANPGSVYDTHKKSVREQIDVKSHLIMFTYRGDKKAIPLEKQTLRAVRYLLLGLNPNEILLSEFSRLRGKGLHRFTEESAWERAYANAERIVKKINEIKKG